MAPKTSEQRQKARQQRRERRKRKRTQARARYTTRPSSVRALLRRASEWPLMECLLTEGWQEPGEIIQILVARRSSQGQIAAGVFLVDLGCLGVKNAFARMFDSRGEYGQLRDRMQEDQTLVSADPNLAAKIIREGVTYAEKLGFRPNRDYGDTMLLLGDADPDACEVPTPLGKDGKPFFISGPYDNVPMIVAKLERAVGPDGFHYLVGLEEPSDDFD
jgi:hypothetical protein